MNFLNEPKSILPHEWFALALFLTVFAFLTLISWLNGGTDNLEIKAVSEADTRFAYVAGAVKKPGCFRVKSGAMLQELIGLAEPLEEADLSNLDLGQEVKEGMKVVLKKIKKITLHIENRVSGQSEIRFVPKGTKLAELQLFLKLKANETILIDKRRKILRDNERIIIDLKGK